MGRVSALAGLAASILVVLPTTHPADAATHGVRISHAWMRFIIAARPAAGYFTLANTTDHARVLTGASSPACSMVMLHHSATGSGGDMMTAVGSVTVPARGSVAFSPGGYHLMCMDPVKDFARHRSVPVTLTFKDGAAVSADFKVRGATAH